MGVARDRHAAVADAAGSGAIEIRAMTRAGQTALLCLQLLASCVLLGRALAQWGRRVEPLDTDFGAWVAFERARVNSQARLLLVGNRYGLNSALLATRAAGLKRQEDLEFLGNDTDPNRPWAGNRYRDPAGVEWRQLRVQALLASPAFLDIAL